MTVHRILLAALVLAGVAPWVPAAAADLSIEARHADFDTLWKAVAEDYVYLDGKQAWWSTVRDRYAQRVEAASTADAWASVVEDALSERRIRKVSHEAIAGAKAQQCRSAV